jgi:peroxin-1
VSRKLHLSPSVDLSSLASSTEGFSGADLQAVVYNAHLDCVQSGMDVQLNGSVDDQNSKDESEIKIEWKVFGGKDDNVKERSRAQKQEIERKVRNSELDKVQRC